VREAQEDLFVGYDKEGAVEPIRIPHLLLSEKILDMLICLYIQR